MTSSTRNAIPPAPPAKNLFQLASEIRRQASSGTFGRKIVSASALGQSMEPKALAFPLPLRENHLAPASISSSATAVGTSRGQGLRLLPYSPPGPSRPAARVQATCGSFPGTCARSPARSLSSSLV